MLTAVPTRRLNYDRLIEAREYLVVYEDSSYMVVLEGEN